MDGRKFYFGKLLHLGVNLSKQLRYGSVVQPKEGAIRPMRPPSGKNSGNLITPPVLSERGKRTP